MKRIRYDNDGGSVFMGAILEKNGDRTSSMMNVVINRRIRKSLSQLKVGQCFSVRGKLERYRNKITGKDEDQIKATQVLEVLPEGSNFIDYVANSDLYPNIGSKTAAKLYRRYGRKIFDLLSSKNYSSLMEVDSVTPLKADILVAGWNEDNRGKVIEWLDMHKLPKRLGRKLHAAYDNNSLNRITSDPYRLIAFSVSWKVVDKIAQTNFGIEIDDPRRLHGAVSEALFVAYERDGCTALTKDRLESDVGELIGRGLSKQALSKVFSDGGFLQLTEGLFQSRGAYLQEQYLADEVMLRCDPQMRIVSPDWELALDQWEKDNYLLTKDQRTAIHSAFTRSISIITGGAGVGKTSVLEAIHYAIEAAGGSAIQMALAGRAAKRMQEATKRNAVTIAGFLFKLETEKIKEASHIIIDESSMVDLYSFVKVFRKLHPTQNIVLVGDSAQLPPVGAGRVFHQLASNGNLPVTQLNKIWRQDKVTGIPVISQGVREGVAVTIPNYRKDGKGVSLIKANTKNVLDKIVSVYGELGGDSENADVRIICPTTIEKGWGALGINKQLAGLYCENREEVFIALGSQELRPTGFHVGSIVMATRNNWQKGIMNGSLGRIVRLASASEIEAGRGEDLPVSVAAVEFDGEQIMLDEEDFRTLEWGYAITCHKAQGSQFKKIIIPVVKDTMIDRTWIYTAITRAVEQVVFVGSQQIIRNAITSAPTVHQRTVGFDYHLRAA
ncbi:MAG: AAA family ATPase [Candidatus Thiodiazotropha lotti]